MSTRSVEWPLRYLVIIFYLPIFLIGASSAYFLLENTNWQQMDSSFAAAFKMLYLFIILLCGIVFLLLYWIACLKERLEVSGQNEKGMVEKGL
jgi:hypothetical protein